MNSYRAFKLKLPTPDAEQPWGAFPPSVEESFMRQQDMKQYRSEEHDPPEFQGRKRRMHIEDDLRRHSYSSPPTRDVPFAGKGAYAPGSASHYPVATNGRAPFDMNFNLLRNDRLNELLPYMQRADATDNISMSKYLTEKAQYPPFLPALIYCPPKDQGQWAGFFMPPAQSSNEDDVTSPFPGERKLTSPASPPLSTCDTSSKCSASPSSTDSGYPSSVERSLAEPELEKESKPFDEKKEGFFECSYCKRTFAYLCHLKVHQRVHTGEKPYACKYCPQQFSQLGSLTVHMRIHTGAKPYECSECAKKFRHVNSLRRHQRQVHGMSGNQIASAMDKRRKAEREQEMRYAALAKEEVSPTPATDHVVPFKRRKQISPRRLSEVFMPYSEENRQISIREMAHVLPSMAATPQVHHTAADRCYTRSPFDIKPPRPEIEPMHNKSKFLEELERKNHTGNPEKMTGNRNVSDPPKTNSSSDAKPRVKTWRPFTIDDDEPEVQQVSEEKSNCSNDSVHKVEHRTHPHWRTIQATYTECATKADRGNSTQEASIHESEGHKQPRPSKDRESRDHPDTTHRPQVGIQSFTPLNPLHLWQSSLSLLCQYGKEKRDHTSVTGEETQGKSPRAPSRGEDTPDGDKRDKDGNTSDEGFSSASSTGGATSRKSSLDASNDSDQSLNTSGSSSSGKHSNNERLQNVLQTNLARSKQILASIKVERDDTLDRKWSLDSGLGYWQKE